MHKSTTRFSNRVANYIKYRPSYPDEVFALLRSQCDLNESSQIADIGSGTGILTNLLLEQGYYVKALEPNVDMRKAAEESLNEYEQFQSISAAAEETTLETHSIDLIVAGQAFHWFDPDKSKAEFKRILKPNGWVVLIWNERQVDTTPFLVQYESLLLKHATDYER